jgi:hypothetical protein
LPIPNESSLSDGDDLDLDLDFPNLNFFIFQIWCCLFLYVYLVALFVWREGCCSLCAFEMTFLCVSTS